MAETLLSRSRQKSISKTELELPMQSGALKSLCDRRIVEAAQVISIRRQFGEKKRIHGAPLIGPEY